MEPANDGAITLKPIGHAGEGSTIIMVAAVGDKVVLQFPKAVQWAAVDGQTAVSVGEAMARAAHKIRYGREPASNADVLAHEIKRRAVDEVRERLITRTILILRTMQEKNRRLDLQAAEVVDRILQEVT